MMVSIPENTVTQADLAEWHRLKQELARVKASEMLLRQKIFKFYFPEPVEGTNNAPLNAGWVLKATYPITRDVDAAALGALRDTFIERGLSPDKLVQYKPSLVLSQYRTLTAEEQHLFDQCLIVKPGSPSMDIVLPAKAKKAGEQA